MNNTPETPKQQDPEAILQSVLSGVAEQLELSTGETTLFRRLIEINNSDLTAEEMIDQNVEAISLAKEESGISHDVSTLLDKLAEEILIPYSVLIADPKGFDPPISKEEYARAEDDLSERKSPGYLHDCIYSLSYIRQQQSDRQ